MHTVIDLITNHFLLVPVAAWALSQIIKLFTSMIEYKKFDIRKISRDGGMPSAHSATVTALMVLAGYTSGFGSAEFAICFILAAIVMRDAVGVRRECGKQAEIIKKLAERLEEGEDDINADRLKSGGGHTPLQLAAGCAVGLVVALAYILIVF